jgi:transcriptional regulator with XRE-family HTH domain
MEAISPTQSPHATGGCVADSPPSGYLEQLGARARQRREDLNLTREFVAEHTGTPKSSIYNLEICMKNERLPMEDAWEQVLQAPHGWLRDTTIVAPPVGEFPESPDPKKTVVDEIVRFICWYSRHTCIDRTTEFDHLHADEQEMAEIIMKYYGVLGEELAYLPSATKEQKAASQKCRQMLGRFAKRIGPVAMPACLERLQAAIPDVTPGTLPVVDRKLSSILGSDLSIEGANRFCQEIFDVTLVRIKQDTSSTSPERMVSYLEGPSEVLIGAVRTISLDMVRAVGAAQIQFVTAVVGEETGDPVTTAAVIECCRTQSGFEWINEADGWFWFGQDMHNRIARIALKVFSVATVPVPAEEMQAAVGRTAYARYETYRARTYMVEPTSSVIYEVVSRLPDVDKAPYHSLVYQGRIDCAEVLSEAELAIHDVVRAHGGVANRRVLIRELVSSGRLVQQTMERALDMSPIVKPLCPRVWCLRGNAIEPDALRMALTENSA